MLERDGEGELAFLLLFLAAAVFFLALISPVRALVVVLA